MAEKQLSDDVAKDSLSSADDMGSVRRRRSKQIPAMFIFLGFLLLAGIYRIYFWI